MKALLIILTAFVLMAMIFCSQMSHQKEIDKLEQEKTYWKALFYEMKRQYFDYRKKHKI